MAGVIDFHTHAFPDQVAASAIPALEREGGIKARLDGTVAELLRSMDRSGVEASVLCSIATRPSHFLPILAWSRLIRSERIIPLPSLHPDDPQLFEHLRLVHAEGFAGIKMHSYYQNYRLDDARLADLHGTMAELGMLLVIHAGYDIAYPRVRMADPERILAVSRQFPDLKLIATHLGGWDEWDAVERLLVGQPIFLELSFAHEHLEPARMRRILLAHPADYLLFGTDSPWTDQAASLDLLRRLKLPSPLFERIVGANARRLLTSCFQ